MSSSGSQSSNSCSSSEPEWDPDGLDLSQLPVSDDLSKLDKKLRHTYSFDDFKEFNDVRIFKMQSEERFYSLHHLLKFPSQPFFSSIFSVFNSKTDGLRVERFLQRRFCMNFCNWNPSVCFLEDSHSGCLGDLMSEDFHKLHSPGFQAQFSQVQKRCKLFYPPMRNSNLFHPPRMNKLLDELGISSTLSYRDGKAVNFDYLTKEFRNFERPLYLLEEKKCHDVIAALVEATKADLETHKDEMEKVYQKNSNEKLNKPILSIMMWGPQPSNDFPSSPQPCKLDIDPAHRLVLDKKLHKCKNFTAKDYWMFSHSENCNKNSFDNLDGPSTTDQLTVVYPCNKGKCAIDCTCDLCENTRAKLCPLQDHKKHLAKFDKDCRIQISSQCQDHWVTHPENFDIDVDILVEKNIFYHNQMLVDQPRSVAVDIIKFAGIKKSCKTCRSNIQNHFEKHMVFQMQCNREFWGKVCNFCCKLMSSLSPKQIKWHKNLNVQFVKKFSR